MTRFLTYTKVHAAEEATDLIKLLDSERVEYQIEHNRNLLDEVYIGQETGPMISIKIPEDQFERVNELVKTQAKEGHYSLNPDYYLLHFTNEELMKVARQPEEWSPFDQGMAERLLSERKVEMVEAAPGSSLQQAYVPSKLETQYLILEYLVSVVLPFAGIVIGLATIKAYRVLNNGQRVKIYDNDTHMHARIMVVIGMLRLLMLFYKIYLV